MQGRSPKLGSCSWDFRSWDYRCPGKNG